jgi:ribonuclease D
MQEHLIDRPDTLQALCRKLAGSEWLAVDTEFIRERSYYPRLCLIQVSNGETAACVDPLALGDALTPFLDLLFDGSILKVFHAARQDLEIFWHDWGRFPLPLFDTQPAAALLGHGDQIGYANLVKRVLGVELPKDQSRTDWSARPLNDEQIRYALDDVIYLGQLYLKIRGSLSDRERLQWLAADFATLTDPATYEPDPREVWKRVKGRQHLRGRQLAVLAALAEWRENEARTRDLPRKWLLKDDVMVEICRRLPRNVEALAKIRGVEAGLVRKEGKTLLTLIQKAAALPREAWPSEKRRPSPLTPEQEAMVDYLTAALRLLAAEHQLSPQAIATQKDLQKLVRGEEDCPLLEGWRRAVAGEPLQALLRGERQLVNEDGRLSLQAANRG